MQISERRCDLGAPIQHRPGRCPSDPVPSRSGTTDFAPGRKIDGPTDTVDTLRGGRKGDPQHKVVGKTIQPRLKKSGLSWLKKSGLSWLKALNRLFTDILAVIHVLIILTMSIINFHKNSKCSFINNYTIAYVSMSYISLKMNFVLTNINLIFEAYYRKT